MNRSEMRNSTRRWRALGTTTLALAAVAVVGFTSIAPARADADDWRRGGWHGREWREHRERSRPGFGLYFSAPAYSYSYPSYGYYSYPAYGYSYPAYGYSYPSYGYYPYDSSDYGYDYSR